MNGNLERYVAVEHGLRYFSLLSARRLRLLHAAVLLSGLLMLLAAGPDLARDAAGASRQVMCVYLEFTSDRVEALLLTSGVSVSTVTLLLNVVVGARGVQQDRAIRRQLPALDGRGRAAGAGGHRALYAVLRLAALTTLLQLPHQLFTAVHLVTGAELRRARRLAGWLRVLLFLANGWLFGYWSESGRRRFLYSAVSGYNELPADLRALSQARFKPALREHLFDRERAT
ncbi:hypothetical protein FJT64_026104 [Amphibalanus amphitrite]|uniref:G-protein coupled receptors family 1 profile domain-containing protein n=1 Tax=Amphibalanus amphitrite TaxID=1232801 RepID=A0A6A4W6P5_AMPAM|nr:hypothetical protein FJT64_026104 [Amphibalanus amphitrite]